MNARMVLAVFLIVFGSLALAYGHVSFTRQKTVVDIGPVQVQREQHERIRLPPALGGVAVASGLVLALWHRKA